MVRLRRSVPAAVLLVLLAPLAGCGGGSRSSTQPAPVGDAIVIASISPAEGTKLPPGGTVSFQVTCNYRLVSAATGTVTLTITDGLGNVLPHGTASANVMRGEASVPLSAQITIPATVAVVQVDCALQPTGNTTDVIAANVNFIVGS